MKRNKFKQITGDITGGASTAIFGLPGNIVFGLIAFAPLGGSYSGVGIMAAMYGTIFVCLSSSLLGGSPGMISGPKAATSLIFAAMITQAGLLPHSGGEALPAASILLALPLLAVMFSGIIQILLGMLRIGNIIKYIPHPVLAGILNGSVLLIFISQIFPFLGIERQTDLMELPYLLPDIRPLNAVLVLLTALIMYVSPRVIPRVPGALVAIFLGTIMYHLLEKAGLAGMLGPVMGQVEFMAPSLEFTIELISAVPETLPVMAPALLSAAATIAILNSVDTMLAVSSIQNYSAIRPDNNRLMIAEGMGNIASACFGGLAGSGYVLRSRINYDAGGRTNLSGIIYALVVFICIAFFSPLIGKIPKAVMTGVILMASISIIDQWSLALFKKFVFGDSETRKSSAGNICVLLLVMGICIFYHPVAAVLAGVILSIFLIMIEMSKSLIRREYRANTIHSKAYRHETYMDLLCRHGKRIAVLELEGPIFFGSSDLLAAKIEALAADGVDWILLDLKRVSALDDSGARIIVRTITFMAGKNITIGMSSIREGTFIWQALRDAGLTENQADKMFFRDADASLEYFEDCLLDDVGPKLMTEIEFQISSFKILQGLSPRQTEIFSSFLTCEQFSKQETVFQQGDKGNAIYFIVSGSADITLNITDDDGILQKKRLQRQSAGTIFGEMALIDGRARSADVTAGENLTCFKMNLDRFKEMTVHHPDIAIQVLTGISASLSERIRLSNTMISELERW